MWGTTKVGNSPSWCDGALGLCTADELARFLASSWDEMQHADPRPSDPWAAYTARRIATEL